MRAISILTLLLWLVAGVVFYYLFAQLPYQELALVLRQPNLAAEYAPLPPALTPARYEALRWGSLLLAGASGLGLWLLLRWRGRPRAAQVRQELRRVGCALRRAWQQLRPGQQGVALGLGAAALLLRGWLLMAYPITTDELTSYDYYVQPGAAIAASNYSLPNNHVFYNLLVSGLAFTHLPPDWLQRLPAVLAGLVLLPLSYLLLLRQLRFGTATLALALFTFSTTPAFYAVAGRGYGVQLAAVVAGFFVVLELLRPGGLRQLPWLVFVGSGVLGFYTVPTHAYALAALGLGLLVGMGQLTGPARWRGLAHLTLAASSIALTTAILYAPVGAVTGWAALLHNPYVRPLSEAEFLRGLGTYLTEAATRLWGQGRLTLGWLAVLAVVVPLLLRRASPARRAVGWLSYAVVFLPLPLLALQRVYVPGRALLPAMLFSFVLLALVVEATAAPVVARLPRRWARAAWQHYPVLLASLVLAYGAYRFTREATGMRALAGRYAGLQQQHAWLRAQHPERVWLDSLSRTYQGIYWYHWGLVRAAPLPLRVVPKLPQVAAGPGREYVVFDRQHAGPMPPMLAGHAPAYAGSSVYIWQLPYAP
ncbi:hypothetical protein GCM10027422_00790 [Hymenobacter arcticus]